jgi:hypothetical protein
MQKIIRYLKSNYTIIKQDNANFKNFYKKKLPIFYYLLPLIKTGCVIGIIYFSKLLSDQYTIVLSNAIEYEKPLTNPMFSTGNIKLYQSYIHFLVCVFFVSILADLLISFYIIYYANHPIKNKLLKGTTSLIKEATALSIGVAGYSFTPFEATELTNFFHTKTPFGRGFDYGPYDELNKLKGYILLNKLGKDNLLEALNMHAENLKILDEPTLIKILNDPTYSDILRSKCSFSEARALGLPFVDIKQLIEKNLSENPKESVTKNYDTIFFVFSIVGFILLGGKS